MPNPDSAYLIIRIFDNHHVCLLSVVESIYQYCTDEILISDVNSDKNSLAIIFHLSFLVICA